jgi:hypothetical protein
MIRAVAAGILRQILLVIIGAEAFFYADITGLLSCGQSSWIDTFVQWIRRRPSRSLLLHSRSLQHRREFQMGGTNGLKEAARMMRMFPLAG